MKSLEAVPVFYLEQDSSCDPPVELVSREKAREMKKAGLAFFIDHGKSMRLLGRAPVQEIIPERPGALDTAATISKAEMLANVGLFERQVRNERETTRRAQAKVRLYPHILDSLAPMARGFWPTSALTVIAEA